MVRTARADMMEIWKSATESTIYINRIDDEGKIRKVRVGGAGGGSRTLRISKADRLFHSESIAEECRHLDPFTNGALLPAGEAQYGDLEPRWHLTDADLAEYLVAKDPNAFRALIEEIESELVLRRLRVLCEKDGTLDQNAALADLIARRYPAGGSQRTWLEIDAESKKAPGTRLSG
jgi:hypothetical protein